MYLGIKAGRVERPPLRWLAVACAAMAALLSTVIAGPLAAADGDGAEPYFEEEVIFTQGELGYSCFRIPAVVRAVDGTLLAFAEGRVETCNDDGDIDVVLRRSTDGGQTWGPIQVIDEGNGGTSGNPVPVVDRASGRIAVISTHNPPGPCRNGCDRDPYLLYSEDDGQTWTEPKELVDGKLPHWTWWYGTGPGHGIQLKRGEHAGRMIVPATGEFVRDDGVHVYEQHLLISDDGGLSWRIGAAATLPGGSIKPGELTATELTDGRIYIQSREGGEAPGTRAFAISSDGGESFEHPFKMLPDLVTPEVHSSILRYGATDQGDARDRLLWSGPAHPTTREVMTIRSSFDEGESWQTWDEGKVINWGPSAYSDLVRLEGDRIGLIYETGPVRPYDTLRFARFNEAYLETPNGTPPGFPPAPEPGPTTPDLSDNANLAYVRGGAQPVAGRHGQALRLDGSNDGVQIPYNPTVDLAERDFTFATWIRYSETERSRSILWAYRMNRAPQLWLRAEPQHDRIRAHLHVGTGSVTIASDGAYNDGNWHHLVLERRDGRLILSVDGAEVASGNAPEGSVTSGQEFGIHGITLGQRIDGADRFRGELDDAWLFRRSLTRSEIEQLRTGGVPQKRRLALHLPLDRVDQP